MLMARPATRRSPATFVALGVLGAVVLVIAQLYYFAKLQSAIAGLSGFAFAFGVTFGTSFLFFCTVAAARYVLLLVSAYFGWTHTVRPRPTVTDLPLVSVLVPAFNEAGRIEATLKSILAQSYLHLELIVVDDGSTDGTFEVASRFAGTHGNVTVRVLRKRNGGKSTALNLAFRESRGPLVLCVDADSTLERHAVRRLTQTLLDPRVGAAAGQVRVRNRRTLVAKLQALEYALMNGIPRLAQSNFAHVLIAPGPVAMFRRDVLTEIWTRWGQTSALGPARRGFVAGPWESDTFAEDCDVTLNTLLLGKGVVFEPAAISYTAAPASLFSLLNQRYRWTRGNIQAIRKGWRRWHELTHAPRPFPVWVGIFVIESILWPAVNIYGLIMFGGLLMLFGDVEMLVPWYLILLLIEMNAAGFAIRTMGDKAVLIVLTPIFRSIYSVILDVNTLCSTADELRRRRMVWA